MLPFESLVGRWQIDSRELSWTEKSSPCTDITVRIPQNLFLAIHCL